MISVHSRSNSQLNERHDYFIGVTKTERIIKLIDVEKRKVTSGHGWNRRDTYFNILSGR